MRAFDRFNKQPTETVLVDVRTPIRILPPLAGETVLGPAEVLEGGLDAMQQTPWSWWGFGDLRFWALGSKFVNRRELWGLRFSFK